jgi:3-methyladenine DNA glycosylase Tag
MVLFLLFLLIFFLLSFFLSLKAFLEVQAEFGSFSKYVWGHVGGTPQVNRPASLAACQPTSPAAEQLSRDLKKRGFRFVGPTIVYALMQACGLVEDHIQGCFLCPPDAAAAAAQPKKKKKK